MREMFLDNSIKLLQQKYKYDSDTLDRVKYGLEIIYISITKISVILILSLIFNTFKETIITLIFLNFLRKFAFGLHAKKSWHCYISSVFSFILLPYVFINLTFNLFQKILLSILCFISFVFYAPADTYKRPLINTKQRKKLKILTLIVCSIYILCLFILQNNNNFISTLQMQ